MSFQIKPAVREKTHVLVSLSGPSGCGKTYSALLLARGLVGPSGKIGFIDTEAKRARHYADLTPFDVIDMTPPFSPLRYLEAVRTFVQAGYKALVIDSMSHEWEGTGGCIEMAEGGRGLLAWQKPKTEHKKLMNYLLQVPMHVIFCCRAREKMVQVYNPETGKDEVISQGWHAIAEKNFVFEMTVSMLLDEKTKVPQITKCPEALIHAFPEGKRITPECGARLAAWAEEGVALDDALEALKRSGQEAAEQGTASLRDWFSSLSKPDQVKIKPSLDGVLKGVAEEIDRQRQSTAPADEAGDMKLVASHLPVDDATPTVQEGCDQATLQAYIRAAKQFDSAKALNNWFNTTFTAEAKKFGLTDDQIAAVGIARDARLKELTRAPA